MAESKVKYIDIDQVLKGIRTQIIDSLDYTYYNLPQFKNPDELFDYCRQITTFKHDPDGIELVQSVQTLLENNFHGESGAGDCDCFTVLTIACCVCSGWNDNFIVLVGRTKIAPVHIYSQVKWNGKLYSLDLTNPYINTERTYKYKQTLPL